MDDSRETALSVKIIAERASKACTRNGDGYDLLHRYFVLEESWYGFSDREKATFRKTLRVFQRALREAGFIEG